MQGYLSSADRFVTTRGFDVLVLNGADRLSPGERIKILDIYDSVCDEIWMKPPGWFREHGHDLFPPGCDILIITQEDRPIGFSVVRMLDLCGRNVLFRWFTNIRPAYQKAHILGDITAFLWDRHLKRCGHLPFDAFRTRNPIRWDFSRRFFKRVAPDVLSDECDEELYSIGSELARVLYPDAKFDPQTLAVHDAYEDGVGYQKPYHLRDPAHDEKFYRHPGVANPNGAVIFVGELDNTIARSWLTGHGLFTNSQQR